MAYKIKCPTNKFCKLVQKMVIERGGQWRGGEKIREEPDGCWIFFRPWSSASRRWEMTRCSLWNTDHVDRSSAALISLADIPKLFGKKEES